MQIRKNYLITAAGIMWIVAGINVFHIGLKVWQVQKIHPQLHFWGVLATVLFFAFIFQRSYTKNIHRISALDSPRNPFSFFDVKGWLLIVFMITLGVTVRRFELLPPGFIGSFYIGLGACLAVYGGRFLWKGVIYREM